MQLAETVKQKWGIDGGREIKDDNNHISQMKGSRVSEASRIKYKT